jgi:fibronectin type 3 domain-containing protein
MITCTGYAGTEGATSNRAYAYTINTGGGSPIFFENNGTLKAICPSTTATNNAQIFTCWNNNTNTFINTGLIYSENDSPIGYSFDLYYGVQGYDESFFNSGTITNFSVNSNNGWAGVWMENDADNGSYLIFNSGTIACNSSAMDVFFAGGFGPPGNNHICYTNTGTFNGGALILAFPTTAWEAGQILTTSYGLSDRSQMHVTGLPTINPTINGGGTDSTLDFNLVGTLQYTNGHAASGTNFSGLDGSGSIVVSGKTYSWNNFSNGVSGHVSAAGNVPPPWQQQDIGSVGVAGGAVYAGGLLTLLGSGNDIGSTGDKFHYVYQSMSNNCTLIAFVSSPQSTQALAKAGLMIRDSLNTNAANAFIGVTPGSGVTWQVRSSDGGSTTNSSTTGLSVWCQSYWVKLAQNGTALTGYYSVDGVNWTQLGSTTIASMGPANFGGLAFCNHDNSSTNFGTATFAGVICTGGLLVPSVPTGLTATAGMEQATLNWQAASNAAGYSIGRSTVSGGPYTTVGSVTTTNYTDLNLAGRTTYYYVVTAVTPGIQGTNSAQVNATPTANVPLPWVAQDIGIVDVAGSASCSNSVFTVTASGSDYDASYTYTVNVSDDFRFVYETNNSRNCTIVARVASLQGGNGWSKAGVTIRDSLNANAANVFIGMTPTTNGVVFEHRSSDGTMGNFDDNVTNLVVPCWVELVQSGSTFTGYYSADGNNWTQLGTTTVSMAGTEYVGMAVCANDNGTGGYNNPRTSLCTATFDNVTAPGWPSVAGPTNLTATAASSGQVNLKWNALTNATSYNVKRSSVSGGPYSVIASGLTATNFTDNVLVVGINYYYVVSAMIGGAASANSAEATANLPLPNPWVSLDVGSVGLTGSAAYSSGVFTVTGSGDDIWNTADAFRFVYVRATNNCTIIARVASLQNVDGWSKAGVMIRESTNANAANAFIAVTPGNGVTWQTRSSTGGGTGNAATSGLTAPYWVKLVRSGNTFTGYCSPDGVTWTQQGAATFTMASVAYAGLALTSHNNSSLCTATFDNVTATGWSAPLPPPAPAGLAATTVSSSQITLAWNAVTNAANYNVKSSTTDGGPYTVIATGVTATNYTDFALADGTTYFYVVSAVGIGGESTNSIQATATTLGPLVHQYSFSETSGTNVADSVGGPVWNGTLPNGGTFSNGQLTLASASSQYASLPAGIVGTLSNFTIVVWVRLNSTADWARIFDFGNNTTANMFLTPQSGGSGPMRFAITTGGSGAEQQINSSSALSPGVRHEVAVTLSGSTGVMYLDGSPVGTNSGLTLNPSSLGGTANNYLGKSQYSDPYLNGSLDEFRIYNRALTAVEVAQVYLAGTVTLGNLSQTYNGAAKSAAVTTTPTNLTVNITYNGSADAPTNVGSYTVIGTINDANYQGGATNTLVISQAIRPQMGVALAGTNLTVSWPQTNTGFTVQYCTNLMLGGWLNVTSPAPQIVGNQWQVALPPASNTPSAFYRLSK